MATNRELRTIASIFPECSIEMTSVASSIDEYSRTFEWLTGRRLIDPIPEHISDSTIGELNTIADYIEKSLDAFCKCRNDKTNIKDKHKGQT